MYKIAMLGHKRIPSHEGGVEVVVEELSTRMVKLGHKVTCYNRKGHHVSGIEFDGDVYKDYKGVRLKYVATINKKGIAAVTSSIHGAIYSAFGNYNIVHFHAEGPCAMLWLPKLFGKRCICTVHGLDWKREKWKDGFGAKYIFLGEKVAARFADEIIVLSKDVQDYFKEKYDRDTVLIPNGVGRHERIEADIISKKYGLKKDSYILFLGRLVPEKGVRYLIEAYKKLKTDKKLVIAGGSSDTDGFIDEMKKLASDNSDIIFTGFVQGQKLEELYSNAYVYCLPSDLEGMPLSLLEAMSFGNCCLVSDITECTDVVEDKAASFARGNIGELTKTLQMLCDSPETVEKYKSEAADFICSKYNWDDITEKTLEVYSKKKKRKQHE